MKNVKIVLILMALTLLTLHAADNIRLARTPVTSQQELSPAQMTALLALWESRGIKYHPAKYWNALK